MPVVGGFARSIKLELDVAGISPGIQGTSGKLGSVVERDLLGIMAEAGNPSSMISGMLFVRGRNDLTP
jgi:hypothetical protein